VTTGEDACRSTYNRDVKRWLPFLGPLLVLLILLIRMRGPEPRPANAPPHEFSARRAYATERMILGGIGPHPIGSPANTIVRQRIVAYLTSLGYETRVEHAFGCSPYDVCAWTDNIIAHAPGTRSAPALALMAHYDSVPAGPGASDDGIGVATLLEVARAVRTESFGNPVLFVITDGEEGGLLGAEAFARDANAPAVATVINVDNRGTSGPSLLFETSAHNRRLAERVVHALPRPATSSLFATIYDLIPHDTDLTVFKQAGKAGVNFAAIGDVWAYHTPLDNLARVNLRTLQQHGDNAIAALRALAKSDLHETSDQNAVWFDVLLWRVISWRNHFTLLIAILALVAAAVAAALLIREEEATLAGIVHGALGFLGAIVVAAVIGAALGWIATQRKSVDFIAYPLPAIASMWLTGLAAAVFVPSTLRRWTTGSGMLAGQALVWSLLAIVLALVLPGGSYLAIVPALVLDALAFVHAFTQLPHEVSALIASFAISIPFFTSALVLYDGLGNVALPIIAACVAMALAVMAMTFESRPLAGVAIALAVVLALLSLGHPDSSRMRPRAITLAHVTEGNVSRWLTDATTEPMRRVTTFSRFVWPWSSVASWEAPAAPVAGLAPVQLDVVRDTRAGKRTLAVRVHSQRGARRVVLRFRTTATVAALRINGVTPPPPPPHFYGGQQNGWRRMALEGGGDATFEITTRGAAPIDLVASDVTFGIPDSGRLLAHARDASDAITANDGDVTITIARKRV
jgi:Peptidase family M28